VVSMLASGTFGGLVVSMLASGTLGGLVVSMLASGTFGGLMVSMLASGAQVRGFKPANFWRKNPQHAFLRRESKAFCPMSQPCGIVKEPYDYRGSRKCRLNVIGHFSSIVPPLANRGLSRRLMWSVCGDEGGN
jgi:hypothetical protein